MPSEKLQVILELSAGQYKSEAKQAASATSSIGDAATKTGRSMTRNLTLPLIAAGTAAVTLAIRQAEAEAKITQTVKSMNAATWTSVEALKAQASAFQQVTTFGDEAILGFQDLLLTFGNVVDRVGEGNDIFTQATRLGLDMSQALGQDLKSSAIQLGKALNDPIQGVTALRRVGVSFTQAQVSMIRSLQESGDLMGAQKLILSELEKQFGGTAEAVANTAGGKMKQALNDLGDAAEDIGDVLLPILADIAKHVSNAAKAFQRMSDPQKKFIVFLGGVVAIGGPALIVVGQLAKAYTSLRIAILGANAAAAASPFTALASGAKAAVGPIASVGAALLGAEIVARAYGVTSEEANQAVRESGALFGFVGDSLGNLEQKFTKTMASAHRYRGAIDSSTAGTGYWNQELVTSQGLLDHLKGKIDSYSTAASRAAGSIRDVTRAQQDYRSSLLEAVNPAAAALGALRRFEGAVARVKELEKEGKTATDEYREALLEVAATKLETQEALNAFDSSGVQRAIDAIALALNFTKEEARLLLEELGLLRKEKEIAVVVDLQFTSNLPLGKLTPQTLATLSSGQLTGQQPQLRHGGGDIEAFRPYRMERSEVVVFPQSGKAIPTGSFGNSSQFQITMNFHGQTEPAEVRRAVTSLVRELDRYESERSDGLVAG